MISYLGKFLDKLRPKYDDDVVDRCNYLLTNTILFLCAITVAAKQYVGEPLQCWVPAEYKMGWEQYVENYCFVENTYFVMMSENIPAGSADRSQREIHYYQWVPFILMLQAFFFMIPRTIWKTFNWQTGMNIFALADSAQMTRGRGSRKALKSSDPEMSSIPMAKHMSNVVSFNQKKAYYNAKPLSSMWRGYVTTLYIVCKALNLANIALQFVLLNHFLGPQYTFWGIGVLNDIYHGRQWSESGHFPRVTMCDLTIRELGNTNVKTVQCVLMINMFNEKIFIGIWFWLLIVGVLTFINLIYWMIISCFSCYSRSFIESNLEFKNIEYTSVELDGFLDRTVCKDGVTVLRLISGNAGEMVASDVIEGLWKMYKEDSQNDPSDFTEEVSDLSVESSSSSRKQPSDAS